MKLTEPQIRAILACAGFELVTLDEDVTVEPGSLAHPSECSCDACQRQRGEEPKP